MFGFVSLLMFKGVFYLICKIATHTHTHKLSVQDFKWQFPLSLESAAIVEPRLFHTNFAFTLYICKIIRNLFSKFKIFFVTKKKFKIFSAIP